MKTFLQVCLCLVVLSAAVEAGPASPPTITVLHAFNGTDGATPSAPLLQASDDNFYGVAIGGVYRISPLGGFGPIYFFNPSNDGSGIDALIQAADGNLYGANYSGPGNTGTVFRISLGGAFQKIPT